MRATGITGTTRPEPRSTTSSILTIRMRLPVPRGTSAHWLPTSIVRSCTAACTCIRRTAARERAVGSCGTCAKPLRWLLWRKTLVAPRPTATTVSWTSRRPRCMNGYLCLSGPARMLKRSTLFTRSKSAHGRMRSGGVIDGRSTSERVHMPRKGRSFVYQGYRFLY